MKLYWSTKSGHVKSSIEKTSIRLVVLVGVGPKKKTATAVVKSGITCGGHCGQPCGHGVRIGEVC